MKLARLALATNPIETEIIILLQGVINKDVKKALELILKIRNDEQFC